MLVQHNKLLLHNGVSTQPAETILDSQVVEMINATPSVGLGATKRNPMLVSMQITIPNLNTDTQIYTYIDAIGDPITVLVTSDGSVYISNHRTKFVQNTVNDTADTKRYLSGGKLSFASVNDVVFVTNRDIIPTTYSSNSGSSSYKQFAYLWVMSAEPNYGYTYTATITNETTGQVYVTSVSGKTTIEAVVAALADGIRTATGYAVNVADSKIQIFSPYPISIATSDSFGGEALFGWDRAVTNVEQLPRAIAFDNVKVEVVGSTTSAYDNYFLEYDGDRWAETYGWDGSLRPDGRYMPHQIVMNSNGTYSIKSIEYNERVVGSMDTNKVPYFFGKEAIRDIFFFKDRMCFVSRSGIVMSETNEYFNLFRTTIATVLDSDPIIAKINSTSFVDITFGVELNDLIILFGSTAQYRLNSSSYTSASTIEISRVSSYEVDVGVRPVAINDRIFFVNSGDSNSTLMEYMVSPSNDTLYGSNVSLHCSRYIKGKINNLVASPNNNTVIVTTSSTKNNIYLYKYQDNNSTRIQGAWFSWEFKYKPMHISYINNVLSLYMPQDSVVIPVNIEQPIWSNNYIFDFDMTFNMAGVDVLVSKDNIISVGEIELGDIDTDTNMVDIYVDKDGRSIVEPYTMTIQLPRWKARTNDGVLDAYIKMKYVTITGFNDRYIDIVVDNDHQSRSYSIDRSRTNSQKTIVMGNADYIDVTLKSNNSKYVSIHSFTMFGDVISKFKAI